MIRDYMYTIFFIQTLNWQLQWVRVMSLFNRRRFHIFLAGADVLASLPDCLFVCCERYEVKCSIYFFFSIFKFFFEHSTHTSFFLHEIQCSIVIISLYKQIVHMQVCRRLIGKEIPLLLSERLTPIVLKGGVKGGKGLQFCLTNR